MPHLNRKNKLLDFFIYLPILWTFTGLFLFPSGKKIMVGIVFIATLISILSYGFSSFYKNIKGNKFLWLITAYTLFSLIARFYYGYSSSLIRALLCLLVFLAIFPPSLIDKLNLKFLIVLGTLTAFCFVVFQTFILKQGRMWDINPIPYATFSTVLSILSYYYLLHSKSFKQLLLWVTTFTTAIIPLMYSQSRGLWLALSVLVILLTIYSLLKLKKSLYIFIPLIIVSCTTYYLSQDKITQRIAQTKSEIQEIKKGNLSTSFGLRLQMWQTATILFKESPIWGLGDAHIVYKQELAKQKIISPRIVPFTHYHNQFLNDLVKYGLIGLLFLLLSFGLPAYAIKKNKNKHTWPGLLTIIVFIIASLTDVPLEHAQTLTLYFITIYICLYQNESIHNEPT